MRFFRISTAQPEDEFDNSNHNNDNTELQVDVQNVLNSSNHTSKSQNQTGWEQLPGQISAIFSNLGDSDDDDYRFEKFLSQKYDNKSEAPSFKSKKSGKSGKTYRSFRSKVYHSDSESSSASQLEISHEKYFKFLGVDFLTELLLERNRNPTLFLSCVFFFTLVGSAGMFFITLVGNSHKLLAFAILIVFLFTLVMLELSVLNISVINTQQLNKKVVFLFVTNAISGMGLVLYWFIYDTPFHSVSYFLISLEFAVFFLLLAYAMLLTPNNVPENDVNYQLRFFFMRILMAILNSTGAVDVLSDIALGVELIRFRGFLKILGYSLFFLCVMDLMIVQLRILAPNKVTLLMHVAAAVLEVGILTASVISWVKILGATGSVDYNFQMLMYLSLVTTTINFAHHLFVIYGQWLSKKDWQVGMALSDFFG